MKKLFSLIKVSMKQNMNLFRISTKSSSKKKSPALPIVLALLFMFSIWTYANALMEELIPLHIEYALLAIFVGLSAILTVIEGVYKSKDLLFNRKR